jgi:hypothetical protein
MKANPPLVEAAMQRTIVKGESNMKSKFFLIFAILLCLAIAFGCGGTTDPAGSNNTKNTSENKNEEDPGEDEPGEDDLGEEDPGEEEDLPFIETEAGDMVKFMYAIFESQRLSGTNGYPIKLKHSNAAAVFECSVDVGYLSNTNSYAYKEGVTEISKNVIGKPGNAEGSITWYSDPVTRSTDSLNMGFWQQALIEIIVKIDGNIVGYAVINVSRTSYIFTGKILHSALFPQVNGEYQNVSEEQVKAAIEKVKEESLLFVEPEFDEVVEFLYPVFNIMGYSAIQGYPIKLKHSNAAADFECSVEVGYVSVNFLSNTVVPGTNKNVIVKSSDRRSSILWFSDPPEPKSSIGFSQQAFIEIIIKVDSNIVGYSVVKVSKDAYVFTGEILKSELFPQVNGEYQNISEEYVKAAIEQAKERE